MSEVTRILERVQRGEPKAAEELLPLVYDELRKLAAVRMNDEELGPSGSDHGNHLSSKMLRILGGRFWALQLRFWAFSWLYPKDEISRMVKAEPQATPSELSAEFVIWQPRF